MEFLNPSSTPSVSAPDATTAASWIPILTNAGITAQIDPSDNTKVEILSLVPTSTLIDLLEEYETETGVPRTCNNLVAKVGEEIYVATGEMNWGPISYAVTERVEGATADTYL